MISEHFFSFSNGFQKRSYSTQKPSTTNKSALYYIILARSVFYGNMISICSRMKFIIYIKLDTYISIHTQKLKVRSS